MSHLLVLLVGRDIERQLAPFQENTTGTCPEQYLQFVDKESELSQEYLTGSTTRVVMPDGELLAPWDNVFLSVEGLTHRVPDGLERLQVPFRELYASVEVFAQEQHGFKARDEKTQRFGYWENPDKKWSSYCVGGRWTGWLRLCPGAPGEEPPSYLVLDAGTPCAAGHSNSAYRGNVDICSMQNRAEQDARAEYAAFNAARKGRSLPDYPKLLEATGGDEALARDAYWATPVIVDLLNTEVPSYRWNTLAAQSLEESVQAARDMALTPDAIVYEGKWYAQGSSSSREWAEQAAHFWDKLEDDALVTVVDCRT